MSELQTDHDEESLHPMVWAIVVTHQRQRPDLYAGVHRVFSVSVRNAV